MLKDKHDSQSKRASRSKYKQKQETDWMQQHKHDGKAKLEKSKRPQPNISKHLPGQIKVGNQLGECTEGISSFGTFRVY